MKAPRPIFLAAILLAGVCFLPIAALAEIIQYRIELKGSNEVPPNNSTGGGLALLSFDTDSKKLFWVVTYSGLTGPVIGAHLHGTTTAASNAGILAPFRSVASPIEGSETLTEAQASGLLAGLWYVNLHTERHPGGELRGQIVR